MTEWELIETDPITYQRFACDPPAHGLAFRVLDEEWTTDENGDYVYRTIKRIALIDGSGGVT